MVREGKPAAESFSLLAPGESEVMNRPVLYCAQCGTEIQTRHIVWQINRWPAAVDIRALGGCIHCRVGTRLRLRWYADGRLEGPHTDTGRWVRYPAITPDTAFTNAGSKRRGCCSVAHRSLDNCRPFTLAGDRSHDTP